MRSFDETRNNPWPAGMAISVESGANSLLELLWVREAWGLHPRGDNPPPLTNPPIFLGRAEQAPVWEEAWPGLWEECLRHTAHGADPRLLRRLHTTADGSLERAEILSELAGPNWRERFGVAAFDESFSAWQQTFYEELGKSNAVPLDATPERLALDALVPAWEAGLTRVVTIPCEGDYTRVLEKSAMLVTEETRQEPGRYAAALSAFRRDVDV